MQNNPEVAGVQNIKFYVQSVHKVLSSGPQGELSIIWTQKREW